jgi:NodT family efflux transporter outer membrane factor (OMF) lipoprotein
MMNIRQLIQTATASLLIFLQGCTVGPKYSVPSAPTAPAFKEQVAPDGTRWVPASPQDAAQRGKWWTIYNEPELNDLEDKLNDSNQNIAQAYHNFMAARAVVRQARAQYYPTVTTTPSYTRSRSSGSLIGQTIPGENLNSNDFDLPFDISWEPDLWGRIRNTVREYANAAQVSAADLANERLTEQANLAIYYFEIRGQDEQLALYRQTIVAYQKLVDLTRVLSRTGVDDEQSVAEANLNLKTAEAEATNLENARAQYEHAIALLIGQPASTFGMPVHNLTTPLPAIPVGLPSDLLQRRPDIAAAERTMSQANALIGVETAAYYPNLSISLAGGFEGSNIRNWLTWPSRFFSVGPSVSETIFDAGLRHNTLAQYRQQYEADVAAYRETVLTAFQQTEDGLSGERVLTKEIQQEQEVIAAAQRYYDLSIIRYKTGVDNFLNVFTAQTALLSDQQTSITLRVQQMTTSVQLIEALGGGWDTTQLPSEKSVAAKL